MSDDIAPARRCLFCGAPAPETGPCPSCGHDVSAEIDGDTDEATPPDPTPGSRQPVAGPAPRAPAPPVPVVSTGKLVASWTFLVLLALSTWLLAAILEVPALISADRARRRVLASGRVVPKQQEVVGAALGALASLGVLLASWIAMFTVCVIAIQAGDPGPLATAIFIIVLPLLSVLAIMLGWRVARRNVEQAARPLENR